MNPPKIKSSKKIRYYITLLLLTALLFTGCGASQTRQTNQAETDTEVTDTGIEAVNTSSSQVEVDTEFTAKDLEVGYEESTAVSIILNKDSAQITGSGAVFKDGALTISTEGTYVISGTLDDGQLLVDAEDSDKIHLILAGAAITNMNNAPVYIKNADKVFITLKEGTQNNLADSTEYTQSDETNVDSTIFSKADLTINGSGTLTVNGNYKHGILSKDDLVITGGIINVTAVKDALNGKDCVKIKNGTLTLSADTGNGIQSKNDEDATKGYVYIAGGKITVIKSQEGIEGTVIRIDDGDIDVTAEDDGLNSASGSSDTADSGKLSEGSRLDSMEVADRTGEALTRPDLGEAPDGKAWDETDIENGAPAGDMDETSSATITADTPDSADLTRPGRINGGNRSGGFGGGFGGGGEFEAEANCYIAIKGGNIHINASGDGIDSNGNLFMSGGSVYVSGPTNSGNGALDYNGTAEITGGTVIAAGSTGMSQGFSDTSTQYSLLYNLTAVSNAGTEVKLTDETGKVMASFAPDKEYQSVVISTPELEKDKTYTLTSGEQTAQITLTSIVTSNAQQGMGGPGGGLGGGLSGGLSGRGNQRNQPAPDRNMENSTENSTEN